VSTKPVVADNHDYRILFVKRSNESHFMPNTHVFPGGVFEESDSSPVWDAFRDNNSFENSEMLNRKEKWCNRVTAIRELFEETSLLLARTDQKKEKGEICHYHSFDNETDKIPMLRSTINKNASLFFFGNISETRSRPRNPSVADLGEMDNARRSKSSF